MSVGVEIEQRQGLGNVLVATQAYTPGATVVLEKPLLHVLGLKPSSPLYQPLQAYFQQHQMPASVVLKILAYVAASPDTQASVLRCFSPDTTAHADALVVRQARAFATCLLQHPPVPEFAEWAAQQAEAAAAASDTAQQAAFDVLVRVWLIWVMNGHSWMQGSALFEYGSKLTHTCACPNTIYRTAKGDIASVVESVDGSSSGSGGGLQQPGAAAAPAAGGDAAAAGAHLALAPISPGELLTTNYLGMGHKRLMSTPARQKHLQDKFLFTCTCRRCSQQPDLARGIPCPSCSGPFRSEDRLLQEQEALAGWEVGSSLVSCSSSSSSGSGGGGGGGASREDSNGKGGLGGPGNSSNASADNSSSGRRLQCGYIYCDMAELLAGGRQPWKCDVCGVAVADDTAQLWGRFYTKSHATVEGDMEGWVLRLDASMDSAPLVRDPAVLHQRVMGVLRLLGPRHWASWRLLLLGVELHCGALEEAAIKAQMQQSKARRAAADAAKAAADAEPDSHSSSTEPAPDAAAAAAITQQAVWIVRYCKQLWASVNGKYGEVEAGQVLGFHLSEACQVLLSIASSPGLLPQQTANALVHVALQLQDLVLPGVRSIMGPAYNPLAGLLGADSPAAVGGSVDGAAVLAAVRRQQRTQADEASKMLTLVQELQRLAAKEGERA